MARRNRTTSTVVLALALFASSCGGGDNGDARAPIVADNPTGEAAGGGAPVQGGQESANGSGSSANGSSGRDAPGGSGTPSDADGGTASRGSANGSSAATQGGNPPIPLEISLQFPCIKPGERQTITFKTTPKAAVGYNSFYSDGKNGLDKDFYGGNNGGVVPDSGVWTDTWVVAAHAPPGQVRVTYGAANVGYEAKQDALFFDLAPIAGSCP